MRATGNRRAVADVMWSTTTSPVASLSSATIAS
jgi:hypothetical protein